MLCTTELRTIQARIVRLVRVKIPRRLRSLQVARLLLVKIALLSHNNVSQLPRPACPIPTNHAINQELICRGETILSLK